MSKSRTLPVNTGHGEFIDRMMTFGAYLKYSDEKRLQFCQQYNLRLEIFKEGE